MTARASHGLTKEEVAERVRASRLAQGLPAVVTDPVTLRALAKLLRMPAAVADKAA